MAEMKLYLLPKDQIWRIFPERDFTEEEIEDFKRMKIEAYNEARVERINELIEEEKEEELRKNNINLGYMSNNGKGLEQGIECLKAAQKYTDEKLKE